MPRSVVLMSIPGLRPQDVAGMPRLQALSAAGGMTPLTPTFPAVTWTVQANLATGVGPGEHGVVANGLYHRDTGEVEMWTAWNSCLQAPQLWERLHARDPSWTSMVWFPLLSKGADAEYACVPAPRHNPDGTETMWCYTKPEGLYARLLDRLGHFPLINFWGPLANIRSTDWIVDSAVMAAGEYRPRFTFLYLMHLDYAAQKYGPDSPQAVAAVGELDAAIGRLIDGYSAAGLDDVLWLAASEYVITEVTSVAYPNRLLRQAGLLTPCVQQDREELRPADVRAWALVDHQFAHVYVRDPRDVPRAAAVLREGAHIEQVLVGAERAAVGLDHPRAGEIVLIADPAAWFAYYWWLDDARAPAFARTVDIHRKPGYDPVELFIDMPSRQTPLNAALVKGSHGYPATEACRRGVLIASDGSALQGVSGEGLRDTDVAGLVMAQFGIGR
jgi:predicted AlkP superfamily pyrophosphatase or phosphodiesterase